MCYRTRKLSCIWALLVLMKVVRVTAASLELRVYNFKAEAYSEGVISVSGEIEGDIQLKNEWNISSYDLCYDLDTKRDDYRVCLRHDVRIDHSNREINYNWTNAIGGMTHRLSFTAKRANFSALSNKTDISFFLNPRKVKQISALSSSRGVSISYVLPLFSRYQEFTLGCSYTHPHSGNIIQGLNTRYSYEPGGSDNLAYKKRTNQSDLSSRGFYREHDFNRAVNGEINHNYTEIAKVDDTIWWIIDLGQRYDISTIAIYFKQRDCQSGGLYHPCYDDIKDFTIKTALIESASPCDDNAIYWVQRVYRNIVNRTTWWEFFEEGILAKYVGLCFSTLNDKSLNLLEVEIYPPESMRRYSQIYRSEFYHGAVYNCTLSTIFEDVVLYYVSLDQLLYVAPLPPGELKFERKNFQLVVTWEMKSNEKFNYYHTFYMTCSFDETDVKVAVYPSVKATWDRLVIGRTYAFSAWTSVNYYEQVVQSEERLLIDYTIPPLPPTELTIEQRDEQTLVSWKIVTDLPHVYDNVYINCSSNPSDIRVLTPEDKDTSWRELVEDVVYIFNAWSAVTVNGELVFSDFFYKQFFKRCKKVNCQACAIGYKEDEYGCQTCECIGTFTIFLPLLITAVVAAAAAICLLLLGYYIKIKTPRHSRNGERNS